MKSMKKITSDQLKELVKKDTEYDLNHGSYKSTAEQSEILSKYIIPCLKEKYGIKFPYGYKPTTYSKFINEVLSFWTDSDIDTMSFSVNRMTKDGQLPVRTEILKNYANLVTKIQDDRDELDEILEDLENSNNSVKITRNWYGTTNLESIKNAIEEVNANLSHYIGKCGDAICKVNDNQYRTLELIALLATAERDLYEQFDKAAMSTNELRTIIKDWCVQHGINDEEVQKLLDLSFQRSVTLRDRINNLSKDIDNRLSEFVKRNNEQEDKIKKIVQNTEQNIANAVSDCKEYLKSLIDKEKTRLEKKENELQKRIEALNTHVENTTNPTPKAPNTTVIYAVSIILSACTAAVMSFIF